MRVVLWRSTSIRVGFLFWPIVMACGGAVREDQASHSIGGELDAGTSGVDAVAPDRMNSRPRALRLADLLTLIDRWRAFVREIPSAATSSLTPRRTSPADNLSSSPSG